MHASASKVVVDEHVLDDVRSAWRDGAHAEVSNAPIESIELGAALEAACWGVGADDRLLALLETWAQQSPALHDARQCLGDAGVTRPEDHDAPPYEVRRCPTRAEFEHPKGAGVEWFYFHDRFRRSLVERLKLPSRTAWDISIALGGMAENVVEHAGLGDVPRAVVAYQVTAMQFAFGVADVGRGVLKSLHDNPRHAEIRTDAEALAAAVRCGASRRPRGRGHGFEDLLKALADMEGRWTFRSGASRLVFDGRGTGARRWSTANTPSMRGFQLSVSAEPAKSHW